MVQIRARKGGPQGRGSVPHLGSFPYGSSLGNGIVACWPMLEAGGNFLNDPTGGGSQGFFQTGTDGTTFPSWSRSGTQTPIGSAIFGNAVTGPSVSLNAGSINYVTSSTPFTISIWFIILSGAPSFATMLSLKNNGTSSLLLAYSEQATYVGAILGSNATWTPIRTGSTLTKGVWYHYVATYVGSSPGSTSSYALYLNDQSQTVSAAGAFGVSANNSLLLVAGGTGLTNNYWLGYVSNLIIYNRVLSRGEISMLYIDPWAHLRNNLGGTIQPPGISSGFIEDDPVLAHPAWYW
jgi:hypothetical protein